MGKQGDHVDGFARRMAYKRWCEGQDVDEI